MLKAKNPVSRSEILRMKLMVSKIVPKDWILLVTVDKFGKEQVCIIKNIGGTNESGNGESDSIDG